MEKINYTLPTFLACALIYGDYSGLTDNEAKDLDTWLETEKPGYCADMAEDTSFCTFHDYNPTSHLAGDCATFTFLTNE